MIALSCHFVYIRGRSWSRSSFPCHMFVSVFVSVRPLHEEEETQISSQMQWGSESAHKTFSLVKSDKKIAFYFIHGFSLDECCLLFILVCFVDRDWRPCDVIARVFRMQRFSKRRLFRRWRTGNMSGMAEASEVWISKKNSASIT